LTTVSLRDVELKQLATASRQRVFRDSAAIYAPLRYPLIKKTLATIHFTIIWYIRSHIPHPDNIIILDPGACRPKRLHDDMLFRGVSRLDGLHVGSEKSDATEAVTVHGESYEPN
jgi:hypothetical protein